MMIKIPIQPEIQIRQGWTDMEIREIREGRAMFEKFRVFRLDEKKLITSPW